MQARERRAGAEQTVDVSFIVGAYNVEAYIAEAIQSALRQERVSVEVIVTDDASVDKTGEIVAGMAASDPRVRLISLTRNCGLSHARNAAIAVARGRWLAILDGDDIVAPDRSRRLVDLAELSGADVVADNFERIAEDGAPLGRTMIPVSARPSAFTVDLADFVEGNMTFDKSARSYGAMKQVYEASFVRAHGLRYREDPALRNEDFLFCAEALMAGARLVVTTQSFYKYRQRTSSISHRLTSAHFEAMLRANRAIDLAGFAARSTTGTGTASRLIGAVARYDRALLAGAQYVQLVEDLKRTGRSAVLAAGLLRPMLWPLAFRFGAEGLSRRLRQWTNRPA